MEGMTKKTLCGYGKDVIRRFGLSTEHAQDKDDQRARINVVYT